MSDATPSSNAKTNPCHARQARDVKEWHRETEVAIVGFGGAGGCAAIEAADAGAQVTIFELASEGGGSPPSVGGRDPIRKRGRDTCGPAVGRR